MHVTIIRPTLFVAEVNAIMMRFAAALESAASEVESAIAARAAEAELLLWMEPHEAVVQVTMVLEERRRCAKCSRAASYTRCSGPVCLSCAAAIRNERLSKEWGDSNGS